MRARKGTQKMVLSQEQKEKARQFFRLNGVADDCPYCGQRGWDAREIISCEVLDERGNTLPDSRNAPMVQFVCNNCTHVALFDAMRLGLISAP
jgi:hypothetical protein